MQFQILSCIFIATVSAIAVQIPGGLAWNTINFLEDEIFGDARVIAGPTSCGILGNLSDVICVTETKFKLRDSPTLHSCPFGYVCVDNPLICIQDGIPACRYEKTCGVCLANATNVCLAAKEYAACINGQTDANIKYCPASRPYCTMLYDDEGVLHQECSNLFENACTMNQLTTTPPPPGPFECTTYGKFLDYTDSTCKTYVYCYDNNGEIAEKKYTCEGNLIFHEIKGKCVSPTSFKCLL